MNLFSPSDSCTGMHACCWPATIGLHFVLQSKEEVMAARLREADSMAAVAEMRQRIAELEIQVSDAEGSLARHPP